MSVVKKEPDLIQVILAGLLDKLKIKNPKIFIAVQLGLLTIAGFLLNCEELGWCLAPIFKTIATWINYALMILISPRTSSIITGYTAPKQLREQSPVRE